LSSAEIDIVGATRPRGPRQSSAGTHHSSLWLVYRATISAATHAGRYLPPIDGV